ncbi:MAG: hypothetical protein ACXWM2_01225, partial [Parachlamydiaceae bacterium]
MFLRGTLCFADGGDKKIREGDHLFLALPELWFRLDDRQARKLLYVGQEQGLHFFLVVFFVLYRSQRA